MDAREVLRRNFERRELSAELQVHGDLRHSIFSNAGIEPQLSVPEIREDVRLGEQQVVSPC